MKPDDIPEDVWKTAIRCAEVVCRNLPENYGDMTIEIRAIARAVLAERERCMNIIDAEAEWGGDIREAERKISAGEAPRRIPGYNADYAEGEK